MKILLYSSLFYPSVGGLETQMLALARELSRLGAEVIVVTKSEAEEIDDFPFRIVRRPGVLSWIKLIKWCDIYFQACVSLKAVWPLLFSSKPLVISHQTWYRRHSGLRGIQDYLKLIISKWAANVCPSRALAEDLCTDASIIPNSFNTSLFSVNKETERSKDIAFLGRLVSDKGCDILIDAVDQLRKKNIAACLSIIGDGPERAALEKQVEELKLNSQVSFLGIKRDKELVQLLSQHKILAVPSRWKEPFGIVALEGMACGCIPVGSSGGGLPDAIGGAGLVFESGQSSDLAACIEQILKDAGLAGRLQQAAAQHLASHSDAEIANMYHKFFLGLLGT